MMSEGNGYATKDTLVELSRNPRRYADKDIPGWGKIQVQSVTAGEFCRIDAAKNRAIMLASSGKAAQQAAALRDYFIEIAKTIIVKPAFSDADRELLLSLDSSVADAIKEACLSHCDISEVDAGASQKNLQATSGGSSPTG